MSDIIEKEKSFEERISEEVTNKLNAMDIGVLIAAQVQKGVDESLERLFSYNGGCRKIIEEKLSAVMCTSLEKYDFDEHLVKIDTVLTEVINNSIIPDNKKILESLAEYMKPVDRDGAYILSDIFKSFCECVSKDIDVSKLEEGEEYGPDGKEYAPANAKMEVIDESGSFSARNRCEVVFTCEEDEDLNAKLYMYKTTSKGEDDTWIISAATREDLTMNIYSLRYANSFTILLQRLSSNFAKIKIDAEDLGKEVEIEEKPD